MKQTHGLMKNILKDQIKQKEYACLTIIFPWKSIKVWTDMITLATQPSLELWGSP
jgi:hypothetical protein